MPSPFSSKAGLRRKSNKNCSILNKNQYILYDLYLPLLSALTIAIIVAQGFALIKIIN